MGPVLDIPYQSGVETMRASLAAVALCVVSLPRARCLLGTATPPTEASPESVERVLQPAITFTLAAEPAAAEQTGGEDDWRRLARTVAQLQQLECTEDVLGAQVQMVDAAEQGDRLAMAALGSMFLLGQDCARKRNLTWGYHWLSRAVELEQPDALALMGFLHTTDVLRDLYNFTAVTHHVSHGAPTICRAGTGQPQATCSWLEARSAPHLGTHLRSQRSLPGQLHVLPCTLGAAWSVLTV